MAKVDKTVPRYKYERIKITRIYDADTITCDIWLGFGIVLKKQTFRLARINAFEVRGKEKPLGIKARDYVRKRITEAKKSIHIESFKDAKGKYGRWLCNLYIGDECLNDTLVKLNHARYADY